MSTSRKLLVLASAYAGLAILANWLASKYVITVPFTHYLAPAGVLCIGAVLVLRDWIQQLGGLRVSLFCIVFAGLASYLIAEVAGWTDLRKIAIASVVAFLASETLETVVFTPLRRRNLTAAVALSATAGNALDSYLFLAIAFGSQAFFMGQFVGKLEMIAVGVALTATRRIVAPTPARAA